MFDVQPSPAAASTRCAHCGTPFRARSAEDAFCCEGCRYVANLLAEGGLERFYELKGDEVLPPVGSRAFAAADEAWLQEAQAQAEEAARDERSILTCGLEGISCIACVWLVEAIFQARTGAQQIQIQPQQGRLHLTWRRGVFDLPAFGAELQGLGYTLVPVSGEADARQRTSQQLISRIGLCGFFLLNTMLFTLPTYLGMAEDFFLAPLFQILGALFATMALAVGGTYFIQRAWQAARQRVLHIDLPIALGLSTAYLGSMIGWATGYTSLIYFDFVATFVFLMLVGRWLQEVALEKNRSYLQRKQAGPRDVTRLGGAEDGERIPVANVTSDLAYSIAPGAINPVAADPLDASGTLSLEWINGEAEPVVWSAGRTVPAGAINVGLRSLRLRAREDWADSLLAQLLERPADDFQDRRLQTILKYYIAAVIAIASLGGMAWLAATGDLLRAAQVLISVLIVSCPCATGVALPMCNEFATARLRRAGLFIKNTQIWERLRRVRSVVFDKTGTLTMDVPRLKNPEAVRALDPLAATALSHLVEQNPHPVARSLREALLAGHPGLKRSRMEAQIEETVGQGVAWTDPGGNQWSLGKPGWKNQAPTQARALLCQNGRTVAAFHFEEDVRDDARAIMAFFRANGLKTAILSGDAPGRVAHIASQLGLPAGHTRASCSPREKADWIQQHARGQALMIGDGANDSLAFDVAVCRGTPVVDRSILEASADFFFFGRSLRCLPQLLQVARRRRQTIAVILAAAIVYNLAAVGLCLAGMMHPLLAAILMPLSSIATLALAWAGLSGKDP
ncbi:MAG: heavy metal translocating P-type ATPase metal-binding domain-containing protein [Opitutales bacterium]